VTGPDITRALQESAGGNQQALEQVLPVVYEQLRNIARRELRGERADHTLTPTALVHEAYLKLVKLERMTWESRAHFFAASAQEMRRILISYARRRTAEKRGGGAEHVSIDNALVAAQSRPELLVQLDEALVRLAALDARQARVVECRFFAGMEVEETATALGISPATVKRDWTAARAWLNRELSLARLDA
jgi:RNA polymerase sigma factor (TIGR02999 family)